MKPGLASVLCDALDSMGADYHRDDHYSGRGMYGKETIGIVVPTFGVMLEAVAAGGGNLISISETESPSHPLLYDDGDSDWVNYAADCGKLVSDSMGRGLIFY